MTKAVSIERFPYADLARDLTMRGRPSKNSPHARDATLGGLGLTFGAPSSSRGSGARQHSGHAPQLPVRLLQKLGL